MIWINLKTTRSTVFFKMFYNSHIHSNTGEHSPYLIESKVNVYLQYVDSNELYTKLKCDSGYSQSRGWAGRVKSDTRTPEGIPRPRIRIKFLVKVSAERFNEIVNLTQDSLWNPLSC